MCTPHPNSLSNGDGGLWRDDRLQISTQAMVETAMFAACAGLAYYLGTALRLEVKPRPFPGVGGVREGALALRAG